MIERILSDGNVIAIIVHKEHQLEDNCIQFITSNDYILQLGMMRRPKNYLVSPHMHLNAQRITFGTQEVLFIKKGLLEISFYTEDEKLIESKIVGEGSFILFASGGHSIKMLEDSEIVEVKNGPYDSSKDKRFL